jgi:hypothetical protein
LAIDDLRLPIIADCKTAISHERSALSEGSAEFPAFGNSAAFLRKEPQSLKGKTLRYPALDCRLLIESGRIVNGSFSIVNRQSKIGNYQALARSRARASARRVSSFTIAALYSAGPRKSGLGLASSTAS